MRGGTVLESTGCIWCVKDLLITLWVDIGLLRTDCSPDPTSAPCTDLLATPLEAFYNCSGHELVGLMDISTTTTPDPSITTPDPDTSTTTMAPSTCSVDLSWINWGNTFTQIMDWANTDSSPLLLVDCVGYGSTQLGLYSSEQNANSTCLTALQDFYGELRLLNLTDCYDGSIDTSNPMCASVLAGPLSRFAEAFGDDMDIMTGNPVPRCSTDQMTFIDDHYNPFAPMFAMALKAEQTGDPMVELSRLIEIYYSDGIGPNFYKYLEDLPCRECFIDFVSVATSADSACTDADEGVDGCHESQGVVIGLSVFYPNCPSCKDSIVEPLTTFIYCTGGAPLTTTYVDPFVRAMYPYNETGEPTCNDTIHDYSYYGFAKCALQNLDDLTGADALQCIQDDFVLGPDFRITSCEYAWANMTQTLHASSDFLAACAPDTISGEDCYSYFQNSLLSIFQAGIGDPDFNFGSSSPYLCDW